MKQFLKKFGKKAKKEIEIEEITDFSDLKETEEFFDQEEDQKGEELIKNGDWTDIHKDFGEKDWISNKTYQQYWEEVVLTYQDAQAWIPVGFEPNDYYSVEKWKNQNFTPQQVKSWIDIGLKSNDYKFIHYLKQDGYQLTDLNQDNLEELKKKVSWQDIHEDFSFWEREKWEENGFTYQEAQEWITAGFKLRDYDKVKEWKYHNFAPSEAKSWIDIGLKTTTLYALQSNDDYAKFVAYLRGKGCVPTTVFQEKSQSQHWIDWKYPQEKRNTIEKLDISDKDNYYKKNLTGSLDLRDFMNLEELECSYNQLTSLNLGNCNKLKKLNCRDNNLSDLILPFQGERLTDLDISNNNLSERDLSIFSHLVNLEKLDISGNHFYGSLELLKDLVKLKYLDVSGTDMNNGLEKLPDSLEKIRCWSWSRKNKGGKVKEIENVLQPFEMNIIAWRTAGKPIYENVKSAQEWLDKNYPLEERSSVTKLDIRSRGLHGSLSLKGFDNLEELNCSWNQLDKLDVSCPKLIKLDCHNNRLTGLSLAPYCFNLTELICYQNKLTELDFLTSLDSRKIKTLWLSNNNFSPSNLSCFAKFTDLEKLYLGTDSGKEAIEVYNRFHGSLEPLKNLSKLKELAISATDIDSGLDYLPESLETIKCETFERKGAKVKKIYNTLLPYKLNIREWRMQKNYSFNYWDRDEILLYENIQKQETEIDYLEARVQELTNLIKQRKEKIVSVFTRLLPDKEKEINLIQNLVIAHLEFTKASKQKLPSVPLRRQRDKIRDELEELLGDSLEEEIQSALTDCEELVAWELELEVKLKDKTDLIENQKQILQITDGSEKKAKIKEHEATHQKQIQQAQQAINQLKKQLQAKTQQVSTVLEYQIADKQEQIVKESNPEQKEILKEELKELKKLQIQEQQPQILHQPYGTPGSSKNPK